MKIVLVLLALAACANAVELSSDRKIELPSPSAMVVTELLEVTFGLDADLAKQIGHIFRNVPLSLAKDMVAFIAKVALDITQHHTQNLSVYLVDATQIFSQVWQHIDVKEVIELVASNLLSDKWVKIIMTLVNMIAPKAAFLTSVLIGVTTSLVVSGVNYLLG